MTQGRKIERGGTCSGSGGVGLDPIGMPRLAVICRESLLCYLKQSVCGTLFYHVPYRRIVRALRLL